MKKLLLLLSVIFIFNTSTFLAQTTSQIYSSAMKAYQAHEFAEAKNYFRKFFSNYKLTDGIYSTAKYYEADALLNLGENIAAAAEFEYLVNHFRYSNFRDESLYKLGLIYFGFAEYEKSRERFKTLLEEYPSNDLHGNSLYWIGESYSKENKLDDAITYLKDAIANKQNNKFVDYAIFKLASIYEETGDYKNAVKYYDNLLSYYNDSPLAGTAHIRIGVCYFKLKEYDSSVLELNNPVLKELPDSVYSESLYLLANSNYRLKDYADAQKAYMEIIDRYPDAAQIRYTKYGLAWTYFQQKKYNEAYKVFNNLSGTEDSISVKSFYWKAESKRYAGQELEAFKLYQEFLKKFPGSDLMRGVEYQLGVLYFNAKKFDLAQKYLINAINSSENEVKAKAYTLIGEIQLETKQFDSAQVNFNNALTAPGITNDLANRATLGLGVSNYYLKKFDDAVYNLSGLYSKDPDFEKDKVNFYLAECYYTKGNFKNAIISYDRVSMDDDELGSLALYGKAYCYFNQREYESAAKAFSDFIKKYPDNSRKLDADLRLADSYYASKNFAASSSIYQDLFKFNNQELNSPYAYYQYAQALYKSGKTHDAIDKFTALQQTYPKSEYADKSLYLIGWIYFQQGNYYSAIYSYRDVLNIYSNTSVASLIYYSIGDCYYNIGNYDSAIVNYQTVLSAYPASSHVYDAANGIQDCYVAQGHPEKAVDFIRQYVQQNPSSNFADQIYYKIGDIYYSGHNYKSASASYKDFITYFPKSKLVPQAYYWIGKSVENLDKYTEALFNFNLIFNSYPESEFATAAVIENGNIYNNQQNYDAALNIYDKALSSLPDTKRYPEILFNKGMTLVNKKNDDEAENVFTDVIQKYNGTIFAEKSKLELGIIALNKKQFETADPYFQDLAEKRTDEIAAQAQYYYGVSLFNRNNINDAITSFVRVGTSFPAYDDWVTKSCLKLGDCYSKLNDNQRAKEMYRSVLSKHKNDDYGKEAKAKLRGVR
jgi:TolA-binding protein